MHSGQCLYWASFWFHLWIWLVCFHGEAYLSTIYFYHPRNILHLALHICPGTEGHSKYRYFLLKLDWGWAEHGHGGAAAIWSLMTLLSVRFPQPSTERRMDTTCPSERERKLISVAADGWRTLVERLTVGGVAAVSTCSMWDQIENCEDIPRRAVHSARLPGVSPRENQF